MSNVGKNMLNEEKIDAKAKFILTGIQLYSESIKKSLLAEIPKLRSISKTDTELLSDIIVMFVFFHANKFFWEKIILDKRTANTFETALYRNISQSLNLDPKPFVCELIEYIKRIGPQGELQFLGSKICRDVLKVECGITLMQIITIYTPYHKNLLESCIQAWGIDRDESKGSRRHTQELNQSSKIAWWKFWVVISTMAFSFFLLAVFGKLISIW